METRNCSTCGTVLDGEATLGICPACSRPPLPGTVEDDSRPFDPYATRVEPGPASTQVSGPDIADFGEYELLGELARGSMGVVFRARHKGLNKIVALKMILSAQLASRDEVERFRVEAEAAAGLDHPNIVPIYYFGEHQGRHYFAMKLIDGGSLAARSQARRFSTREAARVVATTARAIHHAHLRGILHRDLKPANVLVDAEGQPHVTDFGLAKRADIDSGLTQSGAVMGTPSYMPPEQASGRNKGLTTAVDVYSLGAILYDLLAGVPPFKSGTIADTLWQVLNEEPRRPRSINAGVDADLETICLKCLEKEPTRRYESADKLADDLDRWLDGKPIAARPTRKRERVVKWIRRRPVIAGLCLALVAVAAIGLVGIMIGWRSSVLYAGIAEDEKNRARIDEREAIRARREARGQLVDLSAASGLAAAKLKDHDRANLWFAHAVQLAQGDPERERVNRIRARNWDRRVCRPVAHRSVPGFEHSKDRFLGFEFHPSGRYVFALTSAGLGLIWDVEGDSGSLLDGSKRLGAATWSPDGKRLAIGTAEGRVEVLEFPALRALDGWDTEGGGVTAMAFSPDGRWLAVGDHRGVRVRDAGSPAFATPRLPHPAAVRALAFEAGGDRLATVSGDRKARVFAVPGDQPGPTFDPVPHSLGGFGVSHGGPDMVAPRFVDGGRTLLTIKDDRDLVWRDSATGAVIATEPSPNGGNLTSLTSSPDGSEVAAFWTTTGRAYSARDRSLLFVVPHTDTWVESAAYAPSGGAIAVAGQDTLVRFWSTAPGDDLVADAGDHPLRHPAMAVRVRYSADGSRLAVAQWDGVIRVWQVAGAPVEDYRVPATGPTRLALSPDGRYVLANGTSFRACRLVETAVLDSATGRAAGPPIRPGGVIVDAAFSPDGRQVATASSAADSIQGRGLVLFEPDGRGGNVQLWDWADGTRVAGPVPMPAEPRGLAYRPDGRELAVTCADGWVVLLEMPGGKVLRTIDTGVRTRPRNANLWWSNGQAQYNPDGRRLMTWEMGPDVHVWDAASGRKLFDLAHNDRIERLIFGPDPNLMISCARDSLVRVWDLERGRLASAPLRHPRWVSAARFSPEGDRIITVCDDGSVRTWDWRAGRLLLARRLSDDIITDFAVTPDRRWLVTVGCAQNNIADARTFDPVAPPLFGSPTINLRVVIPRDGRRAIVSGFSGELIGYDLESLLTPSDAHIDDIVMRAEVVSCQRVYENRELVQLSSAEWLDRWNRLHPRP